jgi:hypothetical protein
MSDQAGTHPEPSGDRERSAPAPTVATVEPPAEPRPVPWTKFGPSPSTRLGASPSTRLGTGWVVVAALALTGLAALGGLWLRDRGMAGRAPAPETLRLRLDLNTASAAELDLLPGIGATRAARLVEERKVRGGFKRMNELDEPGLLGPGASARLAPYVLPLPGDGNAGGR